MGAHTLQHAIGMIHRGVARIKESIAGKRIGPYEWPRSIELVRYVYVKWGHRQARHVSKRGILHRDHFRCAYCGRTGTTVDHVVPRAKGGKTTWLKCVAACAGATQRRSTRR